MKCIEVRKLFSDFIENQTSKYNMSAISGHISRCMKCQEDLEIFKRTVRLIRSAGFVKPSEKFLRNLESKISSMISE